VSPWKILGAKYGAYIAPAFANSSVGASLTTVTGRGVTAETSEFAVGDLFVQPLWLGWALPHWDYAFGYGFYAPVGKYDTDTVILPGGATVTAESSQSTTPQETPTPSTRVVIPVAEVATQATGGRISCVR
jgi:hypothetical protein